MSGWQKTIRHLAIISALLATGVPAEDDWLEDDIAENPYQVRADELRFLDSEADNGWLHALNRLIVNAQSLSDGWLTLEQCYANLDAVPDAEVVYRYREIRDLRVTVADGMSKAEAGEASVKLTGVTRGARLCVSAGVRILEQQKDGLYVIRNGPFHRRFLDGFFPMRVTLDIDFPGDQLEFVRAEPRRQNGFALQHSNGHVHVDTRFTGMLNLAFYFQRPGAGGHSQ